MAKAPAPHCPECQRRLSVAYQVTDYETTRRSLAWTATWRKRINPRAAATLHEGRQETLTVVKLGLPGALRRCLAPTNRASHH